MKKLISMRNTPPKRTLRRSNKAMEAIDYPDEPAYPWGLELSLNADSLKKLDIDVENTKAGDMVYFIAQAQVTRTSLNENLDHRGKRNENGEIGLQIQKMAWGKPEA